MADKKKLLVAGGLVGVGLLLWAWKARAASSPTPTPTPTPAPTPSGGGGPSYDKAKCQALVDQLQALNADTQVKAGQLQYYVAKAQAAQAQGDTEAAIAWADQANDMQTRLASNVTKRGNLEAQLKAANCPQVT